MRCEEARAELAEAAFGVAEGAVLEHLEGCSSCSREAAELGATIARVRAADPAAAARAPGRARRSLGALAAIGLALLAAAPLLVLGLSGGPEARDAAPPPSASPAAGGAPGAPGTEEGEVLAATARAAVPTLLSATAEELLAVERLERSSFLGDGAPAALPARDLALDLAEEVVDLRGAALERALASIPER